MNLTEAVAGYLEHCRTHAPQFKDAAQAITMMTFASPPEVQWEMILESIRQARDDSDLGHIAAGPIEGLLGLHGKDWIEHVEQQAGSDAKFARAMTGVWRYMMSEDVWSRVQEIQIRVPDPLPGFRKRT